MSRHMIVAGSVVGTLLALFSADAHAQWLPTSNPCACAVPVAQPCYRTVPVTEYRQVRHVVQRPVCETKYVNQTVTAYRPVTEARTANVPTVSYEDVTECRTVYRNCGYWKTSLHCRRLPSPCEYDPRPDVFGWLNRTAYSIRATLTPRVVAHREYVPRVVAQTIPTTRRIAHHGTRKVTYNVTRMVPYTTTRKVAVNTVRYVAREVVTNHPVTVWRTVPIGTRMAYAVPATSTALRPTPDPVSRSRTANSQDNKFQNNTNDATKKYERDSSRLDSGKLDGLGLRRSANERPATATHRLSSKLAGYVPQPRSVPSIVRTSRWVARRNAGNPRSPAGPELGTPTFTVARNSSR